MPHRTAGVAAALLIGLSPAPLLAEGCADGQVLGPGDACEVVIKWGYDHWIRAEFPQDGSSQVVFRHLEGACNVALFGPLELDDVVLGPDMAPTTSQQPGEYHLFTRAISVAQQTCRYRISVD